MSPAVRGEAYHKRSLRRYLERGGSEGTWVHLGRGKNKDPRLDPTARISRVSLLVDRSSVDLLPAKFTFDAPLLIFPPKRLATTATAMPPPLRLSSRPTPSTGSALPRVMPPPRMLSATTVVAVKRKKAFDDAFERVLSLAEESVSSFKRRTVVRADDKSPPARNEEEEEEEEEGDIYEELALAAELPINGDGSTIPVSPYIPLPIDRGTIIEGRAAPPQQQQQRSKSDERPSSSSSSSSSTTTTTTTTRRRTTETSKTHEKTKKEKEKKKKRGKSLREKLASLF